jgi:alginate O-acetyltransferase complex protein AlgJ
MLALPHNQSSFPPETASITRVLAADGSPWQPDERADVLVMGDSFNNIYSLAEMGWGASAGFAEHLSAALGRPLDRLVINAGPYRQELVREMAAGRDRLAGKRDLRVRRAKRPL